MKRDIKSAFQILPVHPLDFDLLGFSFQHVFYIDRALPMGCSVSCAAYERFSLFVEWQLRKRAGCSNMANYLDDYLFCGERNSGRCRFILDTFQSMAEELGLPLAEEKTEGQPHP